MDQQLKNELQSLSQLANQLKNDEQKNARTLQNLVQAEEKAQQDLNQIKERLDQLTQDLQVGVGSSVAMGTAGGGSINQMLQQETSPNLLNTTTPAGSNAYQQTSSGYGQQGYYGDAYQQYMNQYAGQQYSNQRGASNTGR